MAGTDKRKQSLYFPEDMLDEIQRQGNRQDRSMSWIVQQAWRLARNEITRFPSVNDVLGEALSEPDERQVTPQQARSGPEVSGSGRKGHQRGPRRTTASRASTFQRTCWTRSPTRLLRQDRSMSWIVQQAWRVARSEIRRLPPR